MVRAAELRHLADSPNMGGEPFRLFLRRHSLSQTFSDELVETDPRFVSEDALRALQDEILGRVNGRGVALEVLPTSNLRIS